MSKIFRKKIGALLLAAVVGVTSLGTVTTAVAGASSSSEGFIDFSFPFDFLFFRFDEENVEMTKEDMELERDRLREQSMVAEKAAGLEFVYEYTMGEPQVLSGLDLSGCKGDGTFVFAKPEFVPEKGVSVCEVVFTPDNVKAYDYHLMLGWDEDTQTLRRYVEVICSSLVVLEEEVVTEPETETTPEETPSQDTENIPEATPEVTPEVEGVPETMPEVTPEESVVPEATPEVTPEESVVPEATPEVTPEERVVPEATPEVTPEGEASHPVINLIPEINSIPELVRPEVTLTPTPVPQVTAPIMQGIHAEVGVPVIMKDETVKSFEERVKGLADKAMDADLLNQLVEITKEYNNLTVIQKESVSSDVMDKLYSLQEQAAVINHTSNGVTVSGNLPWFVQLIVTIGNDTDTYVPTGLETIVPYEMCLWNLLSDSEYVLGGGEKVTLTMAVPENIHLYDGLTIVHYMDETHYEYIELSISGDTLSFETASFSPFNIAGSTVLVGGKTESNTQKPSGSADGSKKETKPTTAPQKPSGSKDNDKKTDKVSGADKKQESNHTGTSVKTGDSSAVSQMIMLALGAVTLIILCILMLKHSKMKNECDE